MKRRYLLLSLLFAFACTPALGAQTVNRPAPLRLTSRLLARRFCAGGAGVDFLHMKLRLQFVNAGDQRLILYKGDNLFFEVWVSSDLDRPSRARYELKTSTARFRTRSAEDVDAPAPGKDFVTLPPGAKFETDITVSLPVCVGCGRVNGAINSGEHLLRITASTWYESKGLGEKLRERWRHKGELWLSPVASEPLRFSGDKSGPLEDCR